MTRLLKDSHDNQIEVANMNVYLDTKVMSKLVVRWFLKDLHGIEIKVK